MTDVEIAALVWLGLLSVATGLFGSAIVFYMNAKQGIEAQIAGFAMIAACGLILAFAVPLTQIGWPRVAWTMHLDIATAAVLVLAMAFWRKWDLERTAARVSIGP